MLYPNNMVPWNEDCNICIGFGYQQYLAILISSHWYTLMMTDNALYVHSFFHIWLLWLNPTFFFPSVWFFSSTFTNVTLWLQSLGIIVLWYISTCRNCSLCRHWFSVFRSIFQPSLNIADEHYLQKRKMI